MNGSSVNAGARPRILSIVGARPQFIKAAAVSRAIDADGRLVEVMVHTGQHFEHNMSRVFFDELAIPPPAHSLGIHGGGHGEMTGRMLAAVESVIKHEGPDAVLVYGDTNSTLAGALASAKLGVPVCHVEAGLRSFNRSMPEEINRVLVDHVSALLFCPTRVAVENLSREGIISGVHAVGDVMYDATLHARERASRASNVLERLGVRAREYSVATIHRQENTDDAVQLCRVVEYLQDVSRSLPVVFPLHPRTRLAAKRHEISLEGLHCCEPVGYLDMTRLLATSACVFTDSGGLQKEAYFHSVPCVTLRAETEWVETVEHGWNRLWSCPEYRPRRPIDDYGCGDASERIVERMLLFLCAS